MQDITRLLGKTESSLLRMVLDSGGAVVALRVPHFRGVLLDDKSFCDTLARRVQREAGVRGFVSTDELPRYGITAQERDRIEAILEAGPEDVVILVADRRDRAEQALEIVAGEVATYRRPRFAPRSRELRAESPAPRPLPRREEAAPPPRAAATLRSLRQPQEESRSPGVPLRLRRKSHPPLDGEAEAGEDYDTGLDKIEARRSRDTGLDVL